MARVTALVTARNEPWLQQTVDDLLAHAEGDLEVVVILDGYWPDPPLRDDPRVVVLHHGESKGLRASINAGAALAHGQYLMKTDAHCAFSPGFDVALADHYEEGWVSAPTRWSLKAETWERGYGPLEYLYLTYPYTPDAQYGEGLHGKKWLGPTGLGSMRPADYYYRERERAALKIDDIQAFQGSCWFTSKATFEKVGGMDESFGTFYQEPQEIAFKCWMSGGRIVVNKHAWYAHWHKSSPPGYGFTRHGKHRDMRYSTWFWMNNQWPLATRTIEEFVAFHWPIPGWPETWQEEKVAFEAAHPVCSAS